VTFFKSSVVSALCCWLCVLAVVSHTSVCGVCVCVRVCHTESVCTCLFRQHLNAAVCAARCEPRWSAALEWFYPRLCESECDAAAVAVAAAAAAVAAAGQCDAHLQGLGSLRCFQGCPPQKHTQWLLCRRPGIATDSHCSLLCRVLLVRPNLGLNPRVTCYATEQCSILMQLCSVTWACAGLVISRLCCTMVLLSVRCTSLSPCCQTPCSWRDVCTVSRV